jgi:hypothetical protein
MAGPKRGARFHSAFRPSTVNGLASFQDVDARHKAGHWVVEVLPLAYVAFFGVKAAFRLSNNSTFTPFRRMMKLCCSTDSVLFQAQ